MGRLGPGAAELIPIAGVGGLPLYSRITAVVLNLTAIGASANTYLTAWASGEPKPVASNLNLPAGDTRPNLVVARVGGGGQVSFGNAAGTIDLITDIAGWYGPGPLADPIPDAPPGSAASFLVNTRHDGLAEGSLALSAPQAVPRWSRDFGTEVGYPLKVGDRVFATVNHSPGYGTDLYALDAATGDTLWGPISLDSRYCYGALGIPQCSTMTPST